MARTEVRQQFHVTYGDRGERADWQDQCYAYNMHFLRSLALLFFSKFSCSCKLYINHCLFKAGIALVLTQSFFASCFSSLLQITLAMLHFLWKLVDCFCSIVSRVVSLKDAVQLSQSCFIFFPSCNKTLCDISSLYVAVECVYFLQLNYSDLEYPMIAHNRIELDLVLTTQMLCATIGCSRCECIHPEP